MSSKVLNPYSVELIQSGNPNLIYAPSSDGYNVYAVVLHSPTKVTCTCEGFVKYHVNCRHRSSTVVRFSYVPVVDDTLTDEQWQEIKARIETEAEKDAYRTMIENEAA